MTKPFVCDPRTATAAGAMTVNGKPRLTPCATESGFEKPISIAPAATAAAPAAPFVTVVMLTSSPAFVK